MLSSCGCQCEGNANLLLLRLLLYSSSSSSSLLSCKLSRGGEGFYRPLISNHHHHQQRTTAMRSEKDSPAKNKSGDRNFGPENSQLFIFRIAKQETLLSAISFDQIRDRRRREICELIQSKRIFFKLLSQLSFSPPQLQPRERGETPKNGKCGAKPADRNKDERHGGDN